MNPARLPRFLALLLLAAGLASAAAPLVTLSTDKEVYLENQPVFLGIHQRPGSGPAAIGSIPLETGNLILEITPPDGRTYRYKPPMTVCLIKPVEPTTVIDVSHTLITGGGRIITASSGLYVLRLLDPKGSQMGPVHKFTVVKPSSFEDLEANKLILSNPGAYADFLFLEGGDHLPGALDVFEKLAKGESSYSPTAQAILSINFSQDMALGRDGRPRKKDFSKAEKYLLNAFDNVNDHLKGKMLLSAGRHFGKGRLSPAVLAKLETARQDWARNPGLLRNDEIKQVLEF